MNRVPYIFLLLFSISLQAHQLRENYLRINYDEKTQTIKMVLEVETRLLERENEILIDDNKNGIISYTELYAHQALITSYTKEHFKLYADTKILTFDKAKILFHRYQDQTYMQVTKTFNKINLNCLELKYNMFFELEDIHKLLIHLDDERGDFILNKKNKHYNFSSFRMSTFERLSIFVKSGIKHILDGYDHLLFVLMILMPSLAFLRLHSNRKIFKISLIEILKIITTFSIAHSITLFISGSGLWIPSTTFIESSIALSIFVVAFMNLLSKYDHINKKIVFLFGLLHGFGFANVLEIAQVDSTMAFVTALFGFNLGVEFGQIFAITLMLPLLYLLSKNRYCIASIKALSLLTMFISAYWFLQRVSLV